MLFGMGMRIGDGMGGEVLFMWFLIMVREHGRGVCFRDGGFWSLMVWL